VQETLIATIALRFSAQISGFSYYLTALATRDVLNPACRTAPAIMRGAPAAYMKDV